MLCSNFISAGQSLGLSLVFGIFGTNPPILSRNCLKSLFFTFWFAVQFKMSFDYELANQSEAAGNTD